MLGRVMKGVAISAISPMIEAILPLVFLECRDSVSPLMTRVSGLY